MTSVTAGWCVVRVTGELDIATAPALGRCLRETVARHPAQGIVVDLRAVTFMDCAGLRPLLQCRREVSGRLFLCGLRPQGMRLLELTGLTGLLSVLDDHTPWPCPADEPSAAAAVAPPRPIPAAREWWRHAQQRLREAVDASGPPHLVRVPSGTPAVHPASAL